MKCPICKKPVSIGDPFMPFCSERCKLIDLGNWASEKYRVPSAVPPPADATPERRYRDEDDELIN